MLKPEQLKKEAYKNAKDFKKKIASLKKEKDKKLDLKINDLDDKAFAHIDCLSCANCCKTLGPLFTQKDVERVAKHLRMKPGAFTEKYLRIDEDHDYVLQETPCSFLDSENYCTIYDVRPKACADYPNTHLKNQKKMLGLLQKNVEYCPAVFEIVEKL